MRFLFLLFLFPTTLFAITPVINTCAGTHCNVSIKIAGVEKFGTKHKEKSKVIEWVSSRKDRKTSWGRPQEWINDCNDSDILTKDGRTFLQSRAVVIAEKSCTEYEMPADFEIQVTDATVEMQAIADKKANRLFLEDQVRSWDCVAETGWKMQLLCRFAKRKL